MTEAQTHYIEPAQLRIGMYIYLDMGWMDHPFPVSSFEIRNQDQLQLRSLGFSKFAIPLRKVTSKLSSQPRARLAPK